MASYSYTRGLNDDDLAPPEVHVYTKKERWENWWDYNLKWVLFGTATLALILYFVLDIFVFTPKVDYQMAVVSPFSVPESLRDEISNQLSQNLEDITGDGVVTFSTLSYQLDLGNAAAEKEDTTEVQTATGDAADTADQNQTEEGTSGLATSELDYYTAMAGQVQLSADLQLGESVIFILYDPESFQATSGVLAYPDGTMPEDPTTVDWRELVYEVSDCTFLSQEVRDALDGYYIARRGNVSTSTVDEKATLYQPIWELLIGDAAPYSEKLA